MAVRERYSSAQVGLHWLIAAMVGYEIVFSEIAESRWAARMAGLAPNVPSVNPHMAVGTAVLALSCLRLAIRLRRGAPPPVERAFLGVAARACHAAFYLLLFTVPLSGLAAWWFGAPQPAQVHALLSTAMIGLITVHAAAAAAHQVVLRNDVLGRMLPARWAGTAPDPAMRSGVIQDV